MLLRVKTYSKRNSEIPKLGLQDKDIAILRQADAFDDMNHFGDRTIVSVETVADEPVTLHIR